MPRMLSALGGLRGDRSVEVIFVLFGLSKERRRHYDTGDWGSRCRQLHISADFNKCLAVNLAVAATTAGKIVVLDDELVFSPSLIRGLSRHATRKTVATLRDVSYPRATGPSAVRRSAITQIAHVVHIGCGPSQSAEIETQRWNFLRCSSWMPGVFSVWRSSFIAVSGMNSQPALAAWAEVDFLLRLELAVGLNRVEYGSATPVMSTSADRDPERLGLMFESGIHRASLQYAQKNFAGTFSDDVRKWRGRAGESRSRGMFE